MIFVSYAQNFEDVRLWRAFGDVGAGRYLDIGTQDPVDDSVSLAFYERGWRGVHVEPTPAYAAAVAAARPDEIVIQAAVSNSPGPLRFYEIPETGLSTGSLEIAERHKLAGWEAREIVVPTVTLASIFDLMGPDAIHWLKVDVEGMEADVLASWGDHSARPAALVIEATAPNTQDPTHEAWQEMVLSRGYTEVLFDGLSRYYVHESNGHRGPSLAMSPNFFDGFQVPKKHFTAGKLGCDHDAAIARVHHEVEEDCDVRILAVTAQVAEADAARNNAIELAQVAADAIKAEADARIEEVQGALLALTRENGRLEGQLTALLEEHSARLVDAEVIRQDLLDRINRAGDALASSQQDAAEARVALADLRERHAAEVAKNAAEARHHFKAQQQAAAHAEALRNEAVSYAARLADMDAARRDLAELLSQSEAATASAHDEIRRTHEALSAQADAQAAIAKSLQDEIAYLRDRIHWRERQLEKAAWLMDVAPQPLDGLPRILAALARRMSKTEATAALNQHEQAIRNWRTELMFHPSADVQQVEQSADESVDFAGLPVTTIRGNDIVELDGPITSVPRLLAPSDREFIVAAYQSVLGRAPDTAGELYYLGRLRAGAHKLEILKQLRRSPEGRAFIPGVAGLDRAIKRYHRANLPLTGAVVRLLTGAEGNSATHRHLRILANEIGRGRSEQASLASRVDQLTTFVQELAARPVVVTEVTPLPPPPPPPPASVQPPNLDPGWMPEGFDSTERRLLRTLRLSAISRGAPA